MKKVTTALLLAGSLAVPTSAFADSLGYSSVPGGVVQTTAPAPTSATAPAVSHSPAAKTQTVANTTPAATPAANTNSGSGLPFTGLDVGLVAAAGVLLLGTGFVLRKVRLGGQRPTG